MSARTKYGAVRCEADGYKFASKREMRAYQDLKLREKAGEIWNLKLQPRFPLVVKGVKVCDYVADFVFFEYESRCLTASRSVRVVADAKGMLTPVYRLKKKLMKAIHGIEIREL